MSKSTRKTGKPLTSQDIRKLKQLADDNTPTRTIGMRLSRTAAAVKNQASKMGAKTVTDQTETAARAQPINATILFADMVDSSMLSHVHSPPEYDTVVDEFQRTAAAVVHETVTAEHFCNCTPHVEVSIRGDELCLVLGCTSETTVKQESKCNPVRCAWTALQVAVRLKRRWLLSKANRRRIDYGQPPLSVAIGIHAGPVVVRRHARFAAGNMALPPEPMEACTAEGYAVNTAKRVETVSRSGRSSRIFLTRPIYNSTPADFRRAFVRVDPPEFKGIPVTPVTYEAKGVGHFDDKCFTGGPEFGGDGVDYFERVVATNPDEIWLVLDLAHYYFDKGDYENAASKYKAVLEADPSFAPAYMYLGRAHFRSYRVPEARAALERSLQLDPGQARANHFLAVCLRREALMTLYDDRLDFARELFKRSIEHHQTACRIAGLENMDYPWAKNGLIWTVAQSQELDTRSGQHPADSQPEHLVRPFDLKMALSEIDKLARDLSHDVAGSGKLHLFLHSKAVALIQLKDYVNAKKEIEASLTALDNRKEQGIPPDAKAYADKRAEMLFHRGRCKLLLPGEGGIAAAIRDWREAKECLLEPWKSEDRQRVLEGQYWVKSPVIKPDGTETRVMDYL